MEESGSGRWRWSLGRVRSAIAVAGVVLAALCIAATPARADKRVALVIGNSAYQNVNPLPNPAHDAAAIADLLRRAGFDVVDARQDVGNSEMRRMIRDFADKVADADIALVYYAGHGIEIDGTNYLLPVDTRLERDVDAEDEAIPLDRVMRILDPARKLRLVMLDACRDNPFSSTMKRSNASRGVTRGGLAKVESTTRNTVIAYAADAGFTASDGAGAHSPFTTALLQNLATPGQELRKSLGYVRDAVVKATANQQEPYFYISLGSDDVILVPGAAAAASRAAVVPPPPAPDPAAAMRLDYELAAQVNTKPAWDAFITAHPSGFYTDLARAARAKLDVVAPSQAPNSQAVNSQVANARTAAVPASTRNISAWVGKSFRLNYVERQQEEDTGKVARPTRAMVIYVKTPNETSSRITALPNDPQHTASRFSAGPLGGVDRGIQVTFDQGLHLLAMTGGGSYRVHGNINYDGTSCTGDVSFELMPGKTRFEMHKLGTGEPVNIASVVAENVACWVAPGDLVGAPAVAPPPAAAPQ